MAGSKGLSMVFGRTVGRLALIAIPPEVAWTASGWAYIGWLHGPVNAEVHHWLVGRARPVSSSPACAGPAPGRLPAGSSGATLPLPVTGASPI
jgi:hypothetical protein